MSKELDDFIGWLVERCGQQISDYNNPEHREQRRTGLRPSLWLHRITQIKNGRVEDAETREWLSCMATFWQGKDEERSRWLADLAGTYNGVVWSVEGTVRENKV